MSRMFFTIDCPFAFIFLHFVSSSLPEGKEDNLETQTKQKKKKIDDDRYSQE